MEFRLKHIFFFHVFCLILILSSTTWAQDIRITEIKKKGGEVEVHYSLQDESEGRSYTINLYSSRDNFTTPLKEVKGDIGIDIPTGNERIIVWDAKEELGSAYSGSLSLEIKGTIYVPFVTFEGLEEGMSFKRETPYDLVWSGGRGDNILNFELYKGDQLVSTFEERPNVGNTSLIIPSKVKPGDNYRLRVSDSRNTDEVVFTNTFSIKRKIPLGAKIGIGVAIVATAGILYAVLNQEEEPIPLPPDPSL